MQKPHKKKQPVKEPQKDNQRYQLKIEQMKLLKKIQGKASLIIKDEQNIILKQIPFQTHEKQVVNVLLDVGICCPKFCLVFNPDGHYYDQELGSIQVNKDHNTCYIYAEKYPYQRGCYVKYKLEYSKKRNHFDNNTVIFDQYLKNQPKSGNKRRHRDILNISQQKQHMYEPKNKIVQLSEQQKDDSLEQLDYNESYDERNIKIIKKVKQASQIVDKSLQKSEDEKKIFSKYLDESTSFINELLGHLNTSSKDKLPKLDISTIKQSNDSIEPELSTQQKWYKNRFNKINAKSNKRAKIFKVIKTGKQAQSKVHLIMSNEDSQSVTKKQISEIIISSTEKPNQINLFVEDRAIKKLRKLARMFKQNGQPSSAWPVQLIINSQYSPIHVSCIVCKQEYIGCIGKEEEKIGQCEIFNKSGESQGYIYFKCKQLCQSVAQTQDLIYPKEEPELMAHYNQNNLKDIQQISKIYGGINQNVFMSPVKKLSPDRMLQKTKQTEQQSEEIPLISRSKTMPQTQENKLKKFQIQNQEQHNLKRQNIFRKTFISHSPVKQIQPITARNTDKPTPDQRKRDMINLKILNINAKLTQPNFAGKFVKIQMNDQPPYFTQSSKQMFYLNWKGKGYIFFNFSKLSKFVLQIFEQNQQTPFSIGNCQINLSQLQPEFKKINKYQDYIRNQRHECVGTIYIQYEFFEKNNNDLLSISPPLSRNKMEYHRSSPDSYRNPNFKLKINKQLCSRDNKAYSLKSSAISESNIKSFKKQRRQMNQSVNQKNSNSVEQHQKHPKSYSKNQGNKSSLKARKYNGGNIIIPRADRFQPKVNYEVKLPGPGYYQYSSQFQRHGSPL